jgi:predicted protein tyrosine phosphatase
MGPGQLVLCHCNAGISRSSAAAIAIWASKLEPNFETAIRIMLHFQSARKQIWPNPHLIRYADEQLGWNGDLVKARDTLFKRQ